MIDPRDYRAIGLPWFRKEDYPALLIAFEDRNDRASTWEQWEKIAEEAEESYKAQGLIVERVYIDPDTFPDWCSKNGFRVDSDATVKFALESAFKKYGRNHS